MEDADVSTDNVPLFLYQSGYLTSPVHNFTLIGNITKSVFTARLNITLDFMMLERHYDLLVQETKMPFISRNRRASFIISLQPLNWLSVEERSSVMLSSQKNKYAADAIDYSSTDISNRYYKHKLQLCLMPDKWVIKWNNELYHGTDNAVSTCFFSDISVAYRTKKYETTLSLNNIFGKNHYERQLISYSQVTTYITHLRPREIMLNFAFSL